MVYQSSKPKLKELSNALLIFRHLDRIGEELRNIFGMQGNFMGNGENLVSYAFQVMHLESLLIAYLDKDYYAEYDEKVEPSLKTHSFALSKDINQKFEYFDAYRHWLALLVLVAHKYDLLERKATYGFYEGAGEESE